MIGLEIHVQLMTKTKMYCRCSTSPSDPNSNCCPVCYGLPGALPVPNRKVLELASRCAHLLGCTLNNKSIPERKNYFYPDLPKGYQISQFAKPIGENGKWFFYSEGEECEVLIKRIQVEEDTAQLLVKNGNSLLDFNRSGIPLLEVVTHPHFSNAREAGEFLRSLRSSLVEHCVSSGKMETGAMRCEPNVSVSINGKISNKVEIKNLGSISGVEKAIKWEIKHQLKKIKSGEKIRSVTKGWDESGNECVLQRVKESASDYRYFPEPDLNILVSSNKKFKKNTPYKKIKKMLKEGVSFQMARSISLNHEIFDYYDSFDDDTNKKTLASWITGSLMSIWKDENSLLGKSPKKEELSKLIRLLKDEKITKSIAKKIIVKMTLEERSVNSLLDQIGDTGYLSEMDLLNLVKKIIQENPEIINKYLTGKTAVLKSLVGLGMRESKGRADPRKLEKELEKLLKLKK